MAQRIIRGVRVATATGIEPASVFIEDGRIAFVAGYEDIPREAKAEELGKSLLMPGLVVECGETSETQEATVLLAGITSRFELSSGEDLELSQYLSKQWTQMRERDQSLEYLIEQLITAPARRADLVTKGRIQAGMDADLVVWNPEYTVTGSQPLLYGLIRQVIVAGVTRVREGRSTGV